MAVEAERKVPLCTPNELDALVRDENGSLRLPADDYNEVIPGLLIGSKRIAMNKTALKELGITHVLNAAEGKGFMLVDTSTEYYKDLDIKYFGLACGDDETTKISEYFDNASQFIDDAVTSGARVTVIRKFENMASPSLSNQFRITLLRVARLLTTDSVQQLAFLCQHISPTNRSELKSAMDLFDQLQEYGVLNERNVNILIDWLDELQLQEASDFLKTYRQTHLENDNEPKRICIEHGEQLVYFCMTCNTKLCPKCFFRSHRFSCEVIEIDQLRQEMDSQKLAETSEKLSQNNNDQDEISGDRQSMLRNSAKWAHKLLKGLRGKQKNPIHPERKEKEIAKVGMDFQNMMKPNTKFASRPELSTIDGTDDWYAQLSRDSTLGSPNDETAEEWYADLTRDNPLGLPSVCHFVGGVMIRENQLVHIFNERQTKRGVLLVCIDPSDTRIEYWNHSVAVNDYKSPVVMSFKELKYGGINHVLFAVGKTVFILHPQRTGAIYDSVHSVASLLIDDVVEGSWITSIVAHRLHSECDEFLISVRGSIVLREYQISGKLLRKIDTRGCVPAISSIAYVQNTVAVCGSRNDIYLISTDSTVNQSELLSDPSRLVPVCVIWTGGAGWMVLFVSKGQEEQVWRVACYNETGKLVKVCVEGTSPRYKGVPVSIARWGNTGFLCFADSSVKSFEY